MAREYQFTLPGLRSRPRGVWEDWAPKTVVKGIPKTMRRGYPLVPSPNPVQRNIWSLIGDEFLSQTPYRQPTIDPRITGVYEPYNPFDPLSGLSEQEAARARGLTGEPQGLVRSPRGQIGRPTPFTDIPESNIIDSPEVRRVNPARLPGKVSKFTGLAKGLSKYGKITGRGLGIASTAMMGNDILEALAPSTEYTTPADIGAWAADKLFRRNKPAASVGATRSMEQPIPQTIGGFEPAFPTNESPIPDLEPLGIPEFRIPGYGGKGTSGPKIRPPKKAKSPLAAFSSLPGVETTSGIQGVPSLGSLPNIPELKRPAFNPLMKDDLPPIVDELTAQAKANMKGAALNSDQQQSAPSAFEKYKQLIMSMPERGKESVWLKIAASLAGAGAGWQAGPGEAYKVSRGIMDAPYDRKMAAWKTQLDELEPLMEAESREYIKGQDIEYRKRRDDLINQTKTVENDIKRLAAEGKITNDAERNSINRVLAEARQHFMNGQLELGQQKLEEVREYHQGLIGVARSRAGTSAAVGASTIKKNEAQAAKANAEAKGGGNNLVDANRRALLQQRARTAAIASLWMESGLNETEFKEKLISDPDMKRQLEQKVQEMIGSYLSGGQ